MCTILWADLEHFLPQQTTGLILVFFAHENEMFGVANYSYLDNEIMIGAAGM